MATGIDGLDPLEVLAGGIDVSQLLYRGTPEEVRAASRQAIADAGRVGYFLGSTTELHWDVKLENAIAMFETAWEAGY